MIPIDEVVHFDVTTHRVDTGAVTDADAPPTFDVFEENTDTPILDDQSMTKRTSLTGNYRGSFTASAANGFEAGRWYSVVVSATVNSVAAKLVAKNFRVAPAENSAGIPKTDLVLWLGTAPLALSSQLVRVSVGAIDDALLTAAKFASGAFDAVWSVGTRTLTSVSGLGIATSAKLLSYFQSALRKDVTVDPDLGGNYDDATDSLEAIRDRGDAAWATATGFSTHSAADVWAVGTRTLTSFGTLVADVTTAVWAAGTRTLTAFDSSFKTGYALSSAGVQAIWDALTSALTTVGSVGKLLVDNINATISSRASQSSVDDVPTNSELATALAAADDAVLAAIAALNNLSQANVRTAIGLASANLDTQLAALAGYVDTEVASLVSLLTAVKAKTDSLTFTVAGHVDANVQRINDTALIGDGSTTPWGPA